MVDLYPILVTRYQGFPLLMVLLFGLAIGSFLGMCVYRLPRKQFFSHHRSFCPQCETVIPWYHNIPLLSYLLLRGRCHACHASISWHYPVAEAAMAAAALALYWRWPFIISDNSLLLYDSQQAIIYAHLAVFCGAMIICTLTDLQWMMIPNAVTYPLIVSGPIWAYFHPALSLQSSLLGIAVGGGLFYALGVLYQLIRKRVGLGLGDVKLLAAIGSYLGAEALTPTILLSSLSALVAIAIMAALGRFHWSRPVPYGPFLALGAVVHIFVDLRGILL